MGTRASKILLEFGQESGRLSSAAFSSSSWNSILCAKNCFDLFAKKFSSGITWPISTKSLCNFIEWAFYTKGLNPSTIKSYVSNLATIHKLKGLCTESFSSFPVKLALRGTENLALVNPSHTNIRKAMSLPLLKILGHELAKKNWHDDSKRVIWAAMNVAFFGSFRMGELLAKSEFSYSKEETLTWADVRFEKDGSI